MKLVLKAIAVVASGTPAGALSVRVQMGLPTDRTTRIKHCVGRAWAQLVCCAVDEQPFAWHQQLIQPFPLPAIMSGGEILANAILVGSRECGVRPGINSRPPLPRAFSRMVCTHTLLYCSYYYTSTTATPPFSQECGALPRLQLEYFSGIGTSPSRLRYTVSVPAIQVSC